MTEHHHHHHPPEHPHPDKARDDKPDGHSHHKVPSPDESSHDHAGHGSHVGHEIMFRNRFGVCLVLTIPVLIYSEMIQMWLGFHPPVFPGSHWVAPVLSIIIFAYGGLPFLQMAGWELKARQPGMMMLISLAIAVAFVYSVATLVVDLGESFFWELVTLIDVMLLGHWLEMRSVRQASGALDELAKLLPDIAERITEDDHTEEILIGYLSPGDKLLVRPGASIPADGVVFAGDSDVNEAMITGESQLIKKVTGDPVIAGTVNEGSSSLRIVVRAVGENTALSGIMRLVQEAQASKSKTQLLADRAAAFLFYAALAAAAFTAIIWLIATGFNVDVLKRVVTVLVIACPHALGLAVPLVVAISTSLAARNGILVRDRLALEAAREINTVIFDKTGTLTKGEQGIVAIITREGMSENEALALAVAVERDSEHPIAKAIRQAADQKGISLPEVREFIALKGRGVQASYKDQPIYVGGPRLLAYLDCQPAEQFITFAKTVGNKGQAVIYLLQADQVAAAFALADVIREESYQAIQQLHKLGIEVVMLTGDSRDVAKAVAEAVGIDHYFAEVLPEDKDKKVAELQQQGRKVAMVGDGVNDAPALTRADIGIAIGSGTDVAVESAGLILVQSNPLDVVKIIKLSQASQRKMKQNIWWAAGYNIVAIPLAAGILAPIGFDMPPAVGALVMSLSTIIVAINAQLLRRVKLLS